MYRITFNLIYVIIIVILLIIIYIYYVNSESYLNITFSKNSLLFLPTFSNSIKSDNLIMKNIISIPQTIKDPLKNLTFCEDDYATKTATCPEGTTLNIKSFLYGRQDPSQCSHVSGQDIKCTPKDYKSAISNTVAQNFLRFIDPINQLVGDNPCPEIYKQINMSYTCEGTPSIIESVPSWTDQGCFKDSKSRSLANQIGSFQTIDECKSAALAAGYNVVGFQSGNECWADTNAAYDLYGQAMNCSPEHDGAWANSVSTLTGYQYPFPNQVSYKGCFNDQNNRAIPNAIPHTDGAHGCIQAALARGYNVAGLQSGDTLCYGGLGSDYSQYGSSTNCTNMPGGTGGDGNWVNKVWTF